jgi:hypothetical protein
MVLCKGCCRYGAHGCAPRWRQRNGRSLLRGHGDAWPPSANVTATLIIKGQDQASAQIDKSTKAAKGLTDQLQQTQSKAQGLTGALRGIASGDIGGFGKLKDTLGGSGGIGPMLATTALGVASVGVAIGAAAIKVTEWSIEIERLRAQMQFAFAGGEAQAIATAQAIGGVAVESVVKLQTTLKASGAEGKITVEALQGIANAATAMGKTGDDALTAFADALRTGSTESLKQVGVFVNNKLAIKAYADAVGKTPLELNAAERSQAVLNAVMAEVPNLVQAGTDAHARQDKSAVDACQQHDGLQTRVVRAGRRADGQDRRERDQHHERHGSDGRCGQDRDQAGVDAVACDLVRRRACHAGRRVGAARRVG